MSVKTVRVREAQNDVSVTIGGLTIVAPRDPATLEAVHVITQEVVVGQAVTVTDGITTLSLTVPYANVDLTISAQRIVTGIRVSGTCKGLGTITAPGGATESVSPDADGVFARTLPLGFADDGASLVISDAGNTATTLVAPDDNGGMGSAYPPVTNLMAAYEGTGEFGVNWTPPVDTSELRTYVVTLDGAYDRDREPQKTSYAKAGLPRGRTYLVGITAIYNGGSSSEATVSVTTK